MENKTATAVSVVLAVVVIALALWYMTTHPVPFQSGALPGGPTTSQSTPQHITDQGQYYDIDAAYPSSTPLATSANRTADATAVSSMKAFEEGAISDFKTNSGLTTLTPDDIKTQGLDQGRKYTLRIDYDATTSPSTLSYVYTIYADTLGAHPNGYYRTFTFDSKTGAELSLADIFTPGADYLGRLSQLAQAQLPGMIAGMENVPTASVDTDYINQGIAPTTENFQSFYLANGNLIIVFPPYQVGPYALGTVLLPIPTSQLTDILKPAYQ